MNKEYDVGYDNKLGWKIKENKNIYINNRRYYIMECSCGCGEVQNVRYDNVDKYKRICEHQKSLIPAKQMSRELYKTRLIGKQFGLLKVIDFEGYNKNKQILYKCECQCENKTIIYTTYSKLISGKKDNCGCKTKEKIRKSKEKYNKYNLDGKFGIGLTFNTNEEFYFDLEDYDKIKDYCWCNHDGYLITNSKNTEKQFNIKIHRLIMNASDFNQKVDHINHNKLDNRKCNLRVCTNQQNCFNHKVHSDNTTGYSGITLCKDRKDKNVYRARIFINKKGIHLGYFDKLEDAVEARRKAEEKYFKEYRINEKYE